MSHQGPMLIREPKLRWPIVMLAALLTAAIALLAAGIYYVTQPNPFNNLAVEITALVKNNTGRKISGSEMRGAIRDAQNSVVRERTVVVIPARQTILEVDEAINVRILLESIDKDSDRAHAVMEVTSIRFD
jgi:DNA-binding response OmpR family regulator